MFEIVMRRGEKRKGEQEEGRERGKENV